VAKNQGGDRGKAANETGTQPQKRTKSPAGTPGRKGVKGGAGRGAGRGKHAAGSAQGAKTSQTRKAGPKKTPRGTTSRSGER
jgi:hypothetical protein